MSQKDDCANTHFAPAERATPAQLAEQRASLAKNPALAAALEAVPGFAALLNEHRQVLMMNSRFRSAFPLSETEDEACLGCGEIVGCPNAATAPSGCGTNTECLSCAIIATIIRALGQSDTNQCEGTLATKNGKLYVEATASPLLLEDRHYVALSINNISEKHALLELDKKLEAQMAHATHLAALGTMAGGIAHEINNPLAIISASCDNLRCAVTALSPDVSRALERIEHGVKRIEMTIKRIIEFALPISDHPTLFSVVDHVEKTLSFLEHTFQNSAIQIVREFQAESPILMGSPRRFQELLRALLTNSQEALMETAQERRIAIRITPHPHSIDISIRDNGCGIAADHLPQVFNPFFTTKEPGRGLGLGLSSAHQTVIGMRGKIEIESEPGHGTLVTMSFPRPRLEENSQFKNGLST